MAAAVGSRVYVMGGALANGAPTAATWAYDPLTNVWSSRAPMPTARSAGMAAVAQGRIFVAGGSPAGSTFEVYDPATNQWSALPAVPTPRNHLAGGISGGRLFAAGGRPPLTLDVLEIFQIGAGTWSTGASMPTGRSGHAAAMVRGCLYAFGGEGNPNHPNGVFPQNEVYDTRSDTWDSLTPMPTPRHGMGAAAVGGRIYIPGGANVQGFGAVATHEVFTVPTRACR
jgi:N-acetylneuraminic acid mutarotase